MPALRPSSLQHLTNGHLLAELRLETELRFGIVRVPKLVGIQMAIAELVEADPLDRSDLLRLLPPTGT